MNLGSLIAKIGADIEPLKQSLRKANESLNEFADKAKASAEATKEKFRGLNKIGSDMSSVGKKMSLGLTLPLAAAAAGAFKLASDMEESINKVDVAFKDQAATVKAWSDTTLKSFGIAKGNALDMAALFGDMSTSMGLNTVEAQKMSTSLVGLAGDLASFKNISTEQASSALKGIYTGETEALKGLGIVMTETNLKEFALSQGIQKRIQDMTQAEKVQLRYAYVMSVTTNAQGDFLRTQGGAANQMRIFTQGLQQLGASLGTVLLPPITKLISGVNDLMMKFQGLTEAQKKTIMIVGGVVAAIGPLLFGVGKFITLIPTLMKGLRGIGVAFKFLAVNPFVLVVAGVIALIAIVVKCWKKLAKFRAFVKYVAQSIAAFFQRAWIAIKMGAEMMWHAIKTYFTAIPKLAAAIWGTIKRVMKGENIGEVIKDEFGKILSSVTEPAKEIREKYQAEMDAIESPDWQTILANERAKQTAEEAGEEIGDAVVDGIEKSIGGGAGGGVATHPMETMTSMTSKNTGGVSTMDGRGGLGLGIASAVQLETEKLEANSAALIEKARQMSSELKGVFIDLGSSIRNMMEDVGVSIGESIGNMISGVGESGDVFKNLLGIVGDFMAQLGKSLIAAGLGKIAFDKLMTSAGGGLAIAAGVALVALAQVVKNSLSSTPGSGGGGGGGYASEGGGSLVPSMATGGLAYGPTLALVGDNPGPSPEVIAPLDRLQGMIGGGFSIPEQVRLTVSGDDLEYVLRMRDKRMKGVR